MTAARQTQDEAEKPAKVWQVQEVANKVDALSQSISEVKQMIIEQNTRYMNRDEIALEFNKRDSRIKDLEKSQSVMRRVVWTALSAIIPTVITVVWNVIVNQSGKGN